MKHSLGIDFPNLPYYIDGDVKISQSMAIMRYIARKHGLDGQTDEEKRRIDVAAEQLIDYRRESGSVFYSPQFEQLKTNYLNGLHDKMKALSDYLGERQWLSGGSISFVDFLMYEWLDVQRLFAPGILDAHSNLVNYMQRFEQLPKVQKYMSSDKFMKWPLNNDSASWGTRLQPQP